MMYAWCMSVNQKGNMVTIFKVVKYRWVWSALHYEWQIQSTSNSKTYTSSMQTNVKLKYIFRLSSKVCKVKYLGSKEFVVYHVYTAVNISERTSKIYASPKLHKERHTAEVGPVFQFTLFVSVNINTSTCWCLYSHFPYTSVQTWITLNSFL